MIPYNRLTTWLAEVPAALRFLAIGAIGLTADISVFTIVHGVGLGVFAARGVSLSFATLVTWILNRNLTFGKSGRHKANEVARYIAVTAVAQGLSYGTFAGLILADVGLVPQVAILAGAAVGAIFSYNGHRLFSFSPWVARSGAKDYGDS